MFDISMLYIEPVSYTTSVPGWGLCTFFILVVSRFKTGIKLKLASKKQPQIGDSYCVLMWRLALVVMAISQLHVGAEREN